MKSFHFSESLLLKVVIFNFLLGFGSSLKCFICDSTTNPGCADLKKNPGIKPEECTVQKIGELDTWLTELNKVHVHDSAINIDVPMKCQKVVGSQGDGDPVTARHCQFDTQDTDPCSITIENAESKSIKIHHCTICSEDACNSAIQTMKNHHLNLGLILLLIILPFIDTIVM